MRIRRFYPDQTIKEEEKKVQGPAVKVSVKASKVSLIFRHIFTGKYILQNTMVGGRGEMAAGEKIKTYIWGKEMKKKIRERGKVHVKTRL